MDAAAAVVRRRGFAPRTLRRMPLTARRPRVLHIVGESEFGGGARVILALALGAQRCGYQVDILTTNERFRRVAENHGVTTVSGCLIKSSISPLHDLVAVARLYRILRGTTYDVVHTHTSKAGVIGRLAAKLAGASLVIHTMHGFPYKDTTRTPLKRLAGKIEVTASRWCHALVTVAHYQSRELLAAGVSAGGVLHVIPNGVVDPASQNPTARAATRREFAVTPQQQLVVCHGRLAVNKGLETLLQALSALMAEGRSVRCLVVGEGPLNLEIRQLSSELGLGDSVTFTGFRSDISALVGASDIVVLPTYREGLSIALLEAMAAGKPIITTDIPGNIEAVGGQAAMVVPAGDSRALALSLGTLLDCPAEQERLGRAARARYEANYTEAGMVASYLDLYRELSTAS